MSYVTNEAALIVIIEALGYKRVPGSAEIDEAIKSHGHKGYTLKPTGSSDEVNTTSSSYVTTDEIQVEVSYRNNDDGDIAVNYDLFLAIELAIQNNTLFKNWTDKRLFGRMKNHDKHSRGTLRFFWGVRSCG